jgi:hypothetical protein
MRKERLLTWRLAEADVKKERTKPCLDTFEACGPLLDAE